MTSVDAVTLPTESLLSRYADHAGAYTDAFKSNVSGQVELQRFLAVFLDTWVFRLERRLLALAGTKGTGSESVKAFAAGDASKFAAWTVEERRDTQVLMKVGSIRTWLGVTPSSDQTQLYFGSALLPRRTDSQGNPAPGRVETWLIPFHKLYSRILLSAATRRLNRLQA